MRDIDVTTIGFTKTSACRFFERIKRAGFDSVRILIRWSSHANATAPYEIEAAFFKRIDWAVMASAARVEEV